MTISKPELYSLRFYIFFILTLSYTVPLFLIFILLAKTKPFVERHVYLLPTWVIIVLLYLVVDILFNYLFSIGVFELPTRWDETLSERFGRYLKEKDTKSIKYKTANEVCKILDRYDKNHCNT